MTAEPVRDDARDPQGILWRLPERARDQFLADYEAAVEGARDPAGYRKLQETLQTWVTLAVAYDKPDLGERVADVRGGRGDYVSLDEVVANHPQAR